MTYGIARVREFLVARGFEVNVSTFDGSTRSSGLAAAAIGCAIGQIAKSLVFVDEDREPVLLIASGTSRIDVKKLAAKLGKTRLKMADAETVELLTGFPVGGVPPVGHVTPLKTLFHPAF